MHVMVTIEHASVYADHPRRAAEHLAALCGGHVEAFHPLEGAYVCLFEGDWQGPLLELYPRTARLVSRGGDIGFEELETKASGAGTHFNLKLDRTRAEVEATCRERGLPCTWRAWAGFLDVWVDEGLLIECVCRP
jgi:hypothetical protein